MKTNLQSARMIRYIVSLVLCLMAISCSQDKTYRIGVSQCSTDDWRRKMNEEIMREAMLHDNIEVEIRSADDSNEKQIADIQYFADNGFDIIVAAPNEADALTPIINKVYDSGTPVIIFDRTINNDRFTAFQGADNAEIGRLAARMARNLGGDNSQIIEIRGLKGSSPELDRHEGFNKEAKRLGLNVLGGGYASWNKQRAAEVADSLLRLYPTASVIYAHNDRMAIAASEVARKMGRKVKVIGIDAAPNIGIKAVNDSIIDATFLYPTSGGQLLRTSLAILENQPYEKRLILPSPAPVDSSNADLLLIQNTALQEETNKILALKDQIDIFLRQQQMQRMIIYGSIIILVLLMTVIFLLIRAYWMRNKNHAQIQARNEELARQKEELHNLYERLQENTASKLTFFTNVSHDLRTPLTLIAEPVAQLAEAKNLTENQRLQMQLADKNVKRLMRLINQILDIRKYDDSRLNLNLATVDLSEALREWTTSFAPAAVKHHIGFNTTIEPDTDFNMALDVEKMERILFNLLSNAFKFTPENGQIEVGLKRVGQEAVVTVADSGSGIPEDEIRSIFDRFFKTDRINPTGSGIGLALSKIFVEMHGGSISVKSEVNRGTTFEVRLPIRHLDLPKADLSSTVQLAKNDTDELAVIDNSDIKVSEDAPTILVIDDNADIRSLMKSILGEKYTVLQASSGAQGIRLATKYIPDLVICDVMMPGMDGYETTRKLKNEVETSHIPVLLLTACSQDEQRTEGYESGADGYMSKPFDSRMLLARCESLIENRKRLLSATEKEETTAAQSSAPKAPSSDIDDEFYNRFIEVVNKEMGNSQLSVEDVADQLGLSRVQMYRKIKALTNYSPAELIRNLRLQKAAKLLKTTQSSVSEVAYTVGFSAPNHFTKCYKQYFGELPTETQQRTSRSGLSNS